MSANRRIVGGVLLVLGIVAAVIGLGVAVVEFWHSLESRHPVIWQNLVGAALFIASGAALVQTGSVRDTLNIWREAIAIWREATPLLESRRIDGNRSTDPKTRPFEPGDDSNDSNDGDASDANRRP